MAPLPSGTIDRSNRRPDAQSSRQTHDTLLRFSLTLPGTSAGASTHSPRHRVQSSKVPSTYPLTFSHTPPPSTNHAPASSHASRSNTIQIPLSGSIPRSHSIFHANNRR
jgi:hypothetical protein